uniref:F-box domain-containing protein n=1 Tax=Oryza nivara TaxID=4536 RepID=A0A0E0IDA4_ORYNI
MKRKREDAAAAADGEIPAAAARMASSSSSSSSSSWGAICDDVVRNIFARLLARDAVASMALSRHHRRLITSPEFARLHCRHGAPLPRPHIAYVATAVVATHRDMFGRVKSLEQWAEQRAKHGFGTGAFACQSSYDDPEQDRSWTYHGFHVAGDGRRRGTDPMRVLARQKRNDQNYVGTCNGVVLLAGKGEAEDDDPSIGLLLNPAVAGDEMKVSLDCSSPDKRTNYHISGLGYGPRTRTYKLLARKHEFVLNLKVYPNGRKTRGRVSGQPLYIDRADELVVYSLGTAAEQQPRTVLAGLDNDKIPGRSLYMDGAVYLLNADKGTVLAFDVDDEAITPIDLPGERVVVEGGGEPRSHAKSDLMEMSGHVCVATADGGDETRYAIWLLMGDRRWERRCAFRNDYLSSAAKVAGVWDCGSGLLILLQSGDEISIVIHDDVTQEVSHLDAPPNAPPEEESDYRICWGYKPTLVSPASIIGDGELSQHEQQRRDLAAYVLAALKPAKELDRRMGQHAALRTVCFMEFLVRIMQKLPSLLHHGITDLDRFY